MTLPVGSAAPDFALRDQHAQLHRLSAYAGSTTIVLVFYPFAFTGVCTGELRAIQAELPSLQSDRVQVLAVSCDPMPALRPFAEQERMAFPLLSDFWPHGAVARAYGAFNDTVGAAERATFIVDRSGVIRWTVHTEMAVARDVTDVQKALAEL